MMIKVSVIVPVYNTSKFLEKCLNSLINQTLQDIEIICINDGSTDNSLEILEKISKSAPPPKLRIITTTNQGISCARNTGMSVAQGEYIGFVDSDDWVDIDFFEKLYNTAKKYDCDIACADFIRQHPKQQKIRLNITEEKVYTKPEDKCLVCKTYREGCVWNKIYRTNFLKGINLEFITGMYYEDRDFTARALYFANKLVTVPGTYYYYFVNPESIVKKGGNKLQGEHYILSRRQVLDFIKEKNINVPDGLYRAEKSRFKIFGKTLFSIRESIHTEYVLLFGKINIFKYKKRKI